MVEGSLPQCVALNGADYFLLAVDHSMRRAGGRGNICQFVIELGGSMDGNDLQNQLQGHPFLSWLSSLKVSRPLPFQIPRWKSKSNLKSVNFREHFFSKDPLNPVEFFRRDMVLGVDTPLAVDLIHQPQGNCHLVFSWNHSVMDAHGAEMLCRALARDPVPNLDLLPSFESPKNSLIKTLQDSEVIKNHVSDATREPMASLIPSNKLQNLKNGPDHYRRILLDPEETRQMDEHALTLGVGAFKSALYLVATARSFKEILLLRGQTPGDFVVPVPQDLRKRGGFGPVFANHVSFLFYRISAHDLSDLKKSVSNLLGQMREMMRLGIQKSYVQFMRLCRRFPLSFYGKFLQSPTKGKMASFYFSDTGTSLEGFEGFMNLPILDAAHFPPNTVPPGVTTIFSRFKGRLGVTVAFSEAALSLEEYESFALALRQTLLGEKRNDE